MKHLREEGRRRYTEEDILCARCDVVDTDVTRLFVRKGPTLNAGCE